MNRKENAIQAREVLDRRLSQMPSTTQFTPPHAGWIRAIRDALGMSAAELGKRMGVSGATVSQLEANEREGGIRLETLRRAANAMNCDLVYAFVPRQSLEQTVRLRAEEVLREHERHADQTMRLEEQESAPSDRARQRQLEDIIRSRNLWAHEWRSR